MLLLFSLTLSLSTSPAPSPLVSLTSSSFSSWATASRKEKAGSVVLFRGAAGQCAACDALAPLLADAVALAAPLGDRLRVAVVDCSVETAVCFRCEVKEYPALRRGVDGAVRGGCAGETHALTMPPPTLGAALATVLNAMGPSASRVEALSQAMGDSDGTQTHHPEWHAELESKSGHWHRLSFVLVVPDGRHVRGGVAEFAQHSLITALARLVAEIVAERYREFDIFVHAGDAGDVLDGLINAKHAKALAGLSALHHQLLANLPFDFERDDATDTAIGPIIARPHFFLAVRTKSHGELRRYDGPLQLAAIFAFIDKILSRRLHRVVTVPLHAVDIALDARLKMLLPPGMLIEHIVANPAVATNGTHMSAFDTVVEQSAYLTKSYAEMFDLTNTYADLANSVAKATDLDKTTSRLMFKSAVAALLIFGIVIGTFHRRRRWRERMRLAAEALSRGEKAFGARSLKRGSLLLPTELEDQWSDWQRRVAQAPSSPRSPRVSVDMGRSSDRRKKFGRRDSGPSLGYGGSGRATSPVELSVAVAPAGGPMLRHASPLSAGRVGSAQQQQPPLLLLQQQQQTPAKAKRPSKLIDPWTIEAAVLAPESPSHAYLPGLLAQVHSGRVDAQPASRLGMQNAFRPVFLPQQGVGEVELRQITMPSRAGGGVGDGRVAARKGRGFSE